MKIKPSPMSATFQENGTGIEVRLAHPRNLFVALFIPIWLCCWAFGWVSAAGAIVHIGMQPAVFFMLFWLLGWSVGGGFAIYAFLWNVMGYETVGVHKDELILKKCIGRWIRSREFDLAEVTRLRVSGPPAQMWAGHSHHPWAARGTMAFDYGAKTYYFGSGVDEAEADKIISALKRNIET